MIYYIVAGIVSFALVYRVCKWYTRRCRCGSWRYSRFHSMSNEGDGTHTSCTFIDCRTCGHFALQKSDTRRFGKIELAWRRLVYPSQFTDPGEYLRRAGVSLTRPQSIAACARRTRIRANAPEDLTQLLSKPRTYVEMRNTLLSIRSQRPSKRPETD